MEKVDEIGSVNRMETGGTTDAPFNTATLTITPSLLALISEREEFKGSEAHALFLSRAGMLELPD